MKNLLLVVVTGIVLASAAGCDTTANENIVIAAGTERSTPATSINGSIVVGEDSVTDGNIKSVNGSIRIKHGAQVADIASVNGSISVGEDAKVGSIDGVNGATECDRNAKINGNIKLVNGPIKVHEGAVVAGNIKTVNGPIRLVGATVEGSVNNYNGGIVITDSSLVKGDVIVSRPRGQDLDTLDKPSVVLGPGARVHGKLKFERPVNLYVHEDASHGGVEGADPIAFSGTELPGDG